MAYAAVISLKHVIERLLKSSEISFVPPSKKIIKSAYKHIESLQEILKRFDNGSSSSGERVNALDEEIRQTICKLEDVIESYVSNQFLSQSERHALIVLSLDMMELKQEIDSFNETIKKMEDEYINLLSCEELVVVSSTTNFRSKKPEMVGLFDQFQEIQTRLLDQTGPFQSAHVSLVGMAGTGKTTLATKLFQDPLIVSHFDCRAFVTIGQKYRLKDILIGILSQLNPEVIDKMLKEENLGLDAFKRMMYQNLKGKTYLIVLDDVWTTQVWNDLGRLFPNNYKSGQRILLTTRLQNIIRYSSDDYKIRLLNKEESWDLLREKVFGEESLFPPELEKAGKKIAEICEGLPLLIVTVAEILSEADKTPEYWIK